MTIPQVAVLGAGVMGSSTALLLSRRGAAVTLFDVQQRPLAGASRWNEGKIHLGFLYSADPSLKTARRILSGGLAFKPMVEALIGETIDEHITPVDDIYLRHKHSVVSLNRMQDYFERVAALVRQHPEAASYLTDVSDCGVQRLTESELASLSDSSLIDAGFRVPERSIATVWLADQIEEAINAEQRIHQAMSTRVIGVRPMRPGRLHGKWHVATSGGDQGPFDFVVNALWEGRLAVDRTAGIQQIGDWSHRFRLSTFIRTSRILDIPSTVIATGPFGDIKNYDGREFYLSWYPAGLIADGSEAMPPRLPALDDAMRQEIGNSILSHLETFLPNVRKVRDNMEKITIAGGWVFAAGRGSLSDPQGTLHRRYDFGIQKTGSYISVDTGKYSTAPWLAHRITDDILRA